MIENNLKIPSNKSFGLVFFVFFILIALYPLLKNENIRIWSIAISFFFLILGLINSKLLTPLNKVWFKFGILLGKFVSPIIMAIIFFLVITPTSIIMKLLNKNLLNLKKKSRKTYWIEKTKTQSKMRNQF